MLTPDPRVLRRLIDWTMPFGRYEGRRLIDLPEPYVVWLRANTDWTDPTGGKLSEALGLLYEVKANGLEDIVRKTAADFIALD